MMVRGREADVYFYFISHSYFLFYFIYFLTFRLRVKGLYNITCDCHKCHRSSHMGYSHKS